VEPDWIDICGSQHFSRPFREASRRQEATTRARMSAKEGKSEVATADVSLAIVPVEKDTAMKAAAGIVSGAAEPAPIVAARYRDPVKWRIPPSCGQQVFFTHVTPLISTGHIRRLEPEDLCHLPELDSKDLAFKFDRDWAEERSKHPEKPSLVRACLVGSRGTLIYTGCLYTISQATLFSGPVLLRLIVEALECRAAGGASCPTNQDLYYYALFLTLAGVVQNLCQAQQDYTMQRLGVRVRNRLMCALYRKVLKLSPLGLQEETTGKIVTLMSNDVNKLQDVFQLLHNIWGAPIFIIAAFAMLYDVIQWSTFIGFLCIIVAAPFTFMVAKTLFAIRLKLLKTAEGRINILSEVINGMRVIKYYAWEKSFKERAQEIRNKEVKLIWASQKVGALFGVALFSTPIFIAVCSLGSYSLAGNTLTASTAYTALALFNMLRFPLILVPFLLTNLLNALSAVQRLGAFLLQDETDKVEPDMSEPGRVRVAAGDFKWPAVQKKPEEPKKGPPGKGGKKPKKGEEPKKADDAEEVEVPAEEPEQPPFELAGVDLDLAPGSLTMVIGRVGCGKSTLLSALNKFVPQTTGDMKVSGRVAYVAQTAWILNSTVKDNILFGQAYDADKYRKCLRHSQLNADLDMLPAGDMTMIGERGVTLSGGQKQRVSIARAVYAAADVYLLDDPLSAVDNHVGAALFEQVLGASGVLRKATRVLVTNALQYLPKADKIVVLEEGKVAEVGTYDELMRKGLDFANLMAAHGIEDEGEDADGKRVSTDGRKSMDAGRKSVDGRKSTDGRKSFAGGEEKPKGPPGAKGKDDMSAEEERSVGNVGGRVYMALYNATGTNVSIPLVAFLFTMDYGSKAFLDYWLSFWAADRLGWESNHYLAVYFGIFLFNGIVFRSIILYFFLVRAAKNIHNQLLDRVIKFPMSFFDTTPSGRVINRFSRDTETIDTILPGIIIQFLGCITSIITTLAIVSVATGWFTLALPFIMFVYIALQRFYIPACRELQRIESISRSPIYSGLGEAVNGVETIRAFRQESHFIHLADGLIQHNADAYVTQKLAAAWLTTRLRFLGTVIVACTAFLVIQGKVGPGVAGLCLVYALDVTKYLEHGTNMASELETKMNAVERVVEYLDKPLESDHETAPKVLAALPTAWPQKGKLEVTGLNMRYRPGLPLVLKDLTFTAMAGEKLGVCGRTGSGKSSLFVALFRVVEPASGTIAIDGVDASTLGLHLLRSKMAMIPQDPFMFAGTIRTNLDPFDEHPEVALWEVLAKVGLRSMVEDAAKKMDMEVVDNGANFSLGQRQLLCMGRALLRNSRVLMMDEATASVDMDSDALIQRTVREAFADCTVLTIAHRLNTIMDSDKVAFLDNGTMAEFGDPADLLKDKNGLFTKLVEQSGKKNSEHLIGLSNAAKERRQSAQNLRGVEEAAEEAHHEGSD
jgi:ATP-binding cassette, subfamily C (CFTR/MRP), member 1